ncbi:MAG: sensor domain-containing phosphodiesterase [Micromonosporaceae bacterium]|nr:sensor domain-containing phosphodiesterase [Micromonosporaceae bacterium]
MRQPQAAERSPQLAWLVTGPLAALAVGLLSAAVGHSGVTFASWQATLLYLALFVLAEATLLEVEVRRHGVTISLADIPMILALLYLPPLAIVSVRVVAYLAVQIRRGIAPIKVGFNLANAAAATSAAALIVSVFGPQGMNHSAWLGHPSSWVVLLGAVTVDVLFSVLAVIGVIGLVQGGMSVRRVVRTATPSLVVGETNAVVGLIVLLAIQHSAWAVLPIVALGGVLVMVYRGYAQSLRRHKSVTEMHDLTRLIAETRHDGTLADVLLGRVRELLSAEYATLWLPAQNRYPETLLSARADDKGLIDLSATPEAMRLRAVETGETVAAGPKLGTDEMRAHLRERGTKDAIVVPLRSGSAVIGCLEVAVRMGDVSFFGEHDVRLLETVAAQVGVAVENNRLVDRLRFDAHHDTLTGLPNRRRMLAALEEAVKIRAPGEVVAVIEFDVSGLRDVNDSLGYAAGDQLLAEVARRLRTVAPPAALVARIGGDQFVVMLRLAGAEAALEFAAQLRTAVQDPLSIGSLTLDVDTAVGIALHPDHGTEASALLQRADVATHAAKTMSSAVQMFNLGMESRSARRLGLATDLRYALDNNEIEVYFQPKVSLRTRQLVGVECLARWEHPTHGSVAPEDFVAVAEHTGLLSRLTDVVLTEGLRRCREWVDASRPLSVAVNLSSRTLMDPTFPARLTTLLDEYHVEPDQLTLEITEDGVITETDRPMPILHKLHDLGVRLSVDDFGTGYSSLSYLRRLPVQEIKIDRNFVQGMATDPGDLAIVRAVVDLSRHFGLTVVAEGVESELTLTLLDDIGCDIGQGYLFSRPLSFDRLEAWFAAQTESEPTPAGEVRRLRAVM